MRKWLYYLWCLVPFVNHGAGYLTWPEHVGDVEVQMFKKKDILQIIKGCKDGSRILIDPSTWIEVHHGST